MIGFIPTPFAYDVHIDGSKNVFTEVPHIKKSKMHLALRDQDWPSVSGEACQGDGGSDTPCRGTGMRGTQERRGKPGMSPAYAESQHHPKLPKVFWTQILMLVYGKRLELSSVEST